MKFAASELSNYIGRITGKKISIAEQGADVFQIAVSTDKAVPAGIRERLKGHGDEAFVVESDGDCLFMVGNSPRAVVYAVYHFLEKHLECRWFTYDPAEEIVPQKSMAEIKTLIKNGIKDFEKPHFPVRMLQYYTYEIGPEGTPLANEVVKSWPQLIQWMAKLRLNIFQFSLDHTTDCIGLWESFRASNAIAELRRRGIELGAGGHMVNLLFMTEKDFQKHPDWRPFYKGERQNRGQFCTCNPDAREHYIQGIVAFLKANPAITYLGLYPNDTGGWCECPLCADTSMPDRLMELNNRMFERLCVETPKVRFSHFAYGSHTALPTREKPSPGMMVNYAPWGRDFSVPIEKSENFRDLFIQWRDYCRQHGKDIILHEKYIRLEWMGFHMLPLPVLSQDMKFYRKEGAGGFEQAAEHAGWWVKSPNSYVLSHLMWNSDENAQMLTDEFFARFYGPCSMEIAECYALVESAMDFQYGGNKMCSCCASFLKKNPEKVIASFHAAHSFAEHARERLNQALQRVRVVRKTTNEPVYSRHLELLEIVLDYVLQEVSAWHEICRGTIAMEQGRAAAATDPAACRKQLDAAAKHFQNAARFDSVRQNYARKTELLGLLWDLGRYGLDITDSQHVYRSAIIPQFQEMIAKLKKGEE